MEVVKLDCKEYWNKSYAEYWKQMKQNRKGLRIAI